MPSPFMTPTQVKDADDGLLDIPFKKLEENLNKKYNEYIVGAYVTALKSQWMLSIGNPSFLLGAVSTFMGGYWGFKESRQDFKNFLAEIENSISLMNPTARFTEWAIDIIKTVRNKMKEPEPTQKAKTAT